MADLHSALHFDPSNLPTTFRSAAIVDGAGKVVASCHIDATDQPFTTVHSVYGRPSDLRAYADALNAAADLGDRRQAELRGKREAEAEKAGR